MVEGPAALLVHVGGEPCTMVGVEAVAEAVKGLRLRMSAELSSYGIDPDLVIDAEIVLGELVANAIEHGQPDASGCIEVGWCVVDRLLRISVIDAGSVTALGPVDFQVDSVRGRGLRLVDTICDRWQADLHAGTPITAEMDL